VPEEMEVQSLPYLKDTFDKAVGLNPNAIPIFHSDRGYQYTSKTFKAKLDKEKMTQSMSRVGHCIDNGPMEGFWGILKSEMYYLHKFNDFGSLEAAVTKYINYYNNKRYQRRLKCMSPLEFHEYLMAA
jgi:putative transposase